MTTSAPAHRELVIVESPDVALIGQRIPLGRAAIAIGRDPGGATGIAVDDPAMGALHAQVGGARNNLIESAGGGTATMVDGLVVASRLLTAGSVIRLGDTLLVFRDVPTAPAARAPDDPALAEAVSRAVLGSSAAMIAIRSATTAAARSDLRVLLEGETGTGKDLVARTLHAISGQPGGFRRVHCAAVEPGEDFGASQVGTVYLDDVGALSAAWQEALLVELERRDTGATRTSRIVAGTCRSHDDLSGGVRADLIARLRQWPIRIAPLRDRREDVLALASVHLAPAGLRLSPDAAEAFLLYKWPYNVREIIHLCRRLALECASDQVPLSLLPEAMQRPVAERLGGWEAGSARPSELELRTALTSFHGNVAHVAEYFGKDRKQIYRWLEACGLKAAAFRKRL